MTQWIEPCPSTTMRGQNRYYPLDIISCRKTSIDWKGSVLINFAFLPEGVILGFWNLQLWFYKTMNIVQCNLAKADPFPGLANCLVSIHWNLLENCLSQLRLTARIKGCPEKMYSFKDLFTQFLSSFIIGSLNSCVYPQ